MSKFYSKSSIVLLLIIVIILTAFFYCRRNRLEFSKKIDIQMSKIENYSYLNFMLTKKLEELENVSMNNLDIWKLINLIHSEESDNFKLENIDLLLDDEQCIKITIDFKIYDAHNLALFFKDLLVKYNNFNIESLIYRSDSIKSEKKLTMVIEIYE